MAMYVAIADYDADPEAEEPELSFREGDYIAVVEHETYAPGSGWLFGYSAEGNDPESSALVPESYVTLDDGSAAAVALPPASSGPAASVSPQDLWRQLSATPLADEVLKQSATDETIFRSYRFVLALDEGSLQLWRSADRAPFPRVCQIELPSIYAAQRVVYDNDPRAAERLDFEFRYNEGHTMRVRCTSAERCTEWLQALTLLAGPNWSVLSGYGLSLRPPRPPHILAVQPGDREAAVTVRSSRDSRVDYFTIRSRLVEPSHDPPGAAGGWGYGGVGPQGAWGGGTVESAVRASDRCQGPRGGDRNVRGP